MNLVGRALIARLLTFPLTAIATFVVTGMFVQQAGAESYGVIALIGGLYLLVPFADLGTGAAVINKLSDPEATGEEKNAVVRTVLLWLTMSGLGLIAVSWTGDLFWSWSDLLGVSALHDRYVNVTTALGLTVFGLTVPVSVGQRLLVGLGKNDLMLYAISSSSLWTLAVAWVMIQFGVKDVRLALSMPLGLLFAHCICFLFGLRSYGVGLSEIIRGRYNKSREVLSQAGPSLVMLVALPLAIQGQRLIVAHVSTPFQLAQYSMAMQLYSPLWSFISAAAMALWPLFAAHRRSSRTELRRLLLRAFAVFAVGGLVTGGGMVVFGNFVAHIVSHGTIGLGGLLSFSAGFLLCVQALQQVPGMFLTTTKGLRFQSYCILGMSVSSLLLSAWGTSIHGIAIPFLSLGAAVTFWQLLPGISRILRQLRGLAAHRALP